MDDKTKVAPPSISPAMEIAKGKTPDQAKMALTPQGKQAAGVGQYPTQVAQPKEPKEAKEATALEVTEEQRDISKRKYSPSEEAVRQRDIIKSDLESDLNLKQLGKTGSELKNILASKMESKLWTGQEVGFEGIASIEDLPEETQTEIFSLMQTLADINTDNKKVDPTDETSKTYGELPDAERDAARKDVVGKLAQTLGSVNEDTGKVNINWELANTIFGSEEDAVGNLIAAGLADEINVDSVVLNALGYDTPEEISSLTSMLDLPVDTNGNPLVSIEQLSQRVDNYLTTQYKEVNDLERILRDPSMSAADRELALSQLRDMGYTGMLATRDQLVGLAEEIEASEGGIEFGGETYGTFEELLSDDNIAGVVAAYMAGTIDEGDLPADLVNLIDNNKEAFEGIVSELKDEVDGFNKIQREWGDLEESVGKDLLQLGGYDTDKIYQTSAPDISTSPVLTYMTDKSIPDNKKLQVRGVLDKLVDVGLESDDIQSLLEGGLNTAELEMLATDEQVAAKYIAGLDFGKKVDNIRVLMESGEEVTKEDILDSLMPGGEAMVAGIEEAIKNLEIIVDVLGDTQAQITLDTLDRLYDSRDPEAMLNSLYDLVDYGDITSVSDANSVFKDITESLQGAVDDTKLNTLAGVVEYLVDSTSPLEAGTVAVTLQTEFNLDSANKVAAFFTRLRQFSSRMESAQTESLMTAMVNQVDVDQAVYDSFVPIRSNDLKAGTSKAPIDTLAPNMQKQLVDSYEFYKELQDKSTHFPKSVKKQIDDKLVGLQKFFDKVESSRKEVKVTQQTDPITDVSRTVQRTVQQVILDVSRTASRGVEAPADTYNQATDFIEKKTKEAAKHVLTKIYGG